MNEPEIQSNSLMPVLKELSDIKSSLSVNTNETANIKASIGEIKQDIRDIKNESVTRREFNEIVTGINKELTETKGCEQDNRQDIDTLKNWRWYILGLTTAAIFIMELYFRFK